MFIHWIVASVCVYDCSISISAFRNIDVYLIFEVFYGWIPLLWSRNILSPVRWPVIFFAFVFSVADFFQCVNFILNNTFSQLSFELFPKLHYTVKAFACIISPFFFLPVMPVIKPQISVCPTTAYRNHATHSSRFVSAWIALWLLKSYCSSLPANIRTVRIWNPAYF